MSDITYIRTHERRRYLAVVIDLFFGQIVGCAMKPRMTTDLATDALLKAVWRRKPESEVLVHSDHSDEWQRFLKVHSLSFCMTRRSNCHDNAMAESFFQLLSRERFRLRIYSTRDEDGSEVFDYIEMFYNSKRLHGSNDGLSPVEFEAQYLYYEPGV